MSIKPEDILSENQSNATINGEVIRKGTVAAFMANIAIYESPTASLEEKQAAWAMIQSLVIKIQAVGLADCVTWKNKDVQKLFEA